MSDSLIQRLEPANEPLLILVFQQIDDSMLARIAEADFRCDAGTHLKALYQIRAGNIPIPMPWNPGLVFDLVQWTEPSDPTCKDVPMETVGHWTRLFACAVLVQASIELENYEYKTEDWQYIDEDHTIAQFLDSALKLGHDTSLAALRFLGWRMQYQMRQPSLDEDTGNCPCYAVAMLLLCVSLDRCDFEIIDFLISVAHSNDEYLPISKIIGESLRSQKWKDMIRRILLESSSSSSAHSNPKLKKFGMELMEGYLKNCHGQSGSLDRL
jgi:hypothetical protein